MARIRDASARIRDVMVKLQSLTDPDATRSAGGATMLAIGEEPEGGPDEEREEQSV